MEENILEWLQQWFISQCDGEWEHDEGIKIQSSDNPGWLVEINVKETNIESFQVDWKLVEKSEKDWYGYQIKNGMYSAAGDPTKLQFLLRIFKSIVTEEKPVPAF